MKKILEIQLLFPILLIFWTFSTPASAQFCYDQSPTCAPNTWPGICNGGTQQSPLNFDGKKTKIKILPPVYRKFYEPSPAPVTNTFLIQNTGHSIEVFFPPGTEPLLRGPAIDLPGDYEFAQMHFHWGNKGKDGTEHRILGVAYALELHLVHFSSVYPSYAAASVAPNDPNAVAILAILFEESPFDNIALKSITDSIPLVRQFNDRVDVTVNRHLDLKVLFPGISNFYRYEGSLTSPDCHENRVWTVFKQTNKISKKQLAVFRSVFFENNVDLILNNHRPLQARNGRPIAFYFVTTSIADWIVRVFAHILSAIRGFLARPFVLLFQQMGLALSRFTLNNGFLSIALK